jgi:4a-hydroxytetrahydrobiopterin dehydratase
MWEQKDNQLYRKFVFNNFIDAFAFMTKVAILAEKANHHPTWSNTWNRVEIWLSTHDAGNVVTDKDLDLSKAIENLL